MDLDVNKNSQLLLSNGILSHPSVRSRSRSGHRRHRPLLVLADTDGIRHIAIGQTSRYQADEARDVTHEDL